MMAIGVVFEAAGAKRPTYAASTTALAAIAPEKPATNDVQPVRKAASRPKAARRYTYSPPARGRSAASSAYAIAPAKARSPPAIHLERNSHGRGTVAATSCCGYQRTPPTAF